MYKCLFLLSFIGPSLRSREREKLYLIFKANTELHSLIEAVEMLAQKSHNSKPAINEPNHYKTCAPSEHLDQPGHPPSLIRVFDVRSMGS